MNVPKLPDHLLAYAREALARFVAVPSVAAEGRAIPEAAALTRELLEAEDVATELHETPGAPVVYGERLVPGAPTLLFYNHYDVQPADPLELWESEPFTLTERGGKLFGRGAADDKGEIISRLTALRWFHERHGELPFGVKFLVEGEEEIGSPNLGAYVETHRERLAADACLWEFGGVDAADRPMTYCGLKGILTLELSVRTAHFDLHSSNGAVVENPVYRLAAALASLRDPSGHILIDGFYDDVVPPTALALRALEALPHEDHALADLWGTNGFLGGAAGTEFQRRLLFEPAVNFNGFSAGYSGPGSKTVLPAAATAKLDVRLVPQQDPDRVLAQLESHLARHGFRDIEVRRLEHYERATRSNLAHPFVAETVAALTDVYGVAPTLYPNSPGSGPMYPFVEVLGLPVVGVGCGYPGSRIHSPNEHLRVADFGKGVQALARIFERVMDRNIR